MQKAQNEQSSRFLLRIIIPRRWHNIRRLLSTLL